MDTPISPTAPDAAAAATPVKPKPTKSLAKRLKAEAEKSREVRNKLADGPWKLNVEYRKGKPFTKDSDEHRVSSPVDWSMTKSKEAGLFSQVPSVILVAEHDRYKPAIPMMQKELNDVLTKQVKIDVTMEELLADLINAAGIGGVMCSYVATFKDVEVPDQPLEMFPPEIAALGQDKLVELGAIKMLPSKKRVDCKFSGDRVSPSQLLWASNFKGSDFDNADWVGYDGGCTWASALREMGKTAERPNGLTPEMKDDVCGGAEKPTTLSPDDDNESSEGDEMVSYTRLFYWAARQDPAELHLEKIREIVFVNGVDEPVVDQDLPAQKWDDASESMIGVTKFPLRIATLTYISDMPVPPSDSEVGRPQVDEKMRSRSQMILQRDRSAPMRWGNVNRIDPMIMASLMTGDGYQRIIPVNGDGSAAIGEVARANYPGENWDFDRVIQQDLMDAWQVGPNQTGSFNTSGRTAAEANIVQSGFATRQAKERGKVGKIFCGIAEVVMGYMQMFYEGPKELALLGDDGVKRLEGAWDRSKVSAAKFVCTIREDSTVKLDSQQRLEQITKFLNLAGKSGFVNVQAIIEEMALLSGLDPAKTIVQPNPTKPEPPNVSLRAGGEDLSDPIVGPYLIALMQKGHPVEAKDIEAAKALLVASSSGPEPVVPPQPGVPGAQPVGAPPVPPAGPAGPQVPQPPKDYGPMERVTKRINEPGG